ncbi:regulator of G-protein signaling 10 isoform X2 [Rhinolophus sinicus]|uniref:regulator of G-protein signaling 10 isoform X2 n=1 Tax=Rhinolophus sinicus TaxID=89399 RepID=UPI00094577A6|nr:PREDICTED: regulator of G-protein signaling 10 isoform X2 [Rhinolophus sinicus]
MFNRAVSRLSRKRPPSDIHDSDGSSCSSHQNPKGTAKWAASLENLLEDPEGVKRFREFLKKEFSEENVLFWLACEDFKKTQDKKQMQEKAKEIYMTFLSSKASSQVNVEGQSRLNEKILEEPHPLMFQKLQDQSPTSSCLQDWLPRQRCQTVYNPGMQLTDVGLPSPETC